MLCPHPAEALAVRPLLMGINVHMQFIKNIKDSVTTEFLRGL